jgi:hypothetical protein
MTIVTLILDRKMPLAEREFTSSLAVSRDTQLASRWPRIAVRPRTGFDLDKILDDVISWRLATWIAVNKQDL